MAKKKHGWAAGNSVKQSELCRRRIRHERAVAAQLERDGFAVYYPTVVCDRVAVRDGRVYFVEFKKVGQELRSGQEDIRRLVPANYLVIRYDPAKL